MRHLTVSILLTLAVLLGSGGESFALPPCPSDQNQRYDNCFGTYTFASGNKYVGEWKDGKEHGQGTYTYDSGSKYVGEYKYGKRHGHFTNSYISGSKYVGEYRNGERHGQGTETYSAPHKDAGAKYVGEFWGFRRHGQGTITFDSGKKYVGEWKKNLKHGQGTFTYANGFIEEGIWEKDKFKYAKKTSPTVTDKKSTTPSSGDGHGQAQQRFMTELIDRAKSKISDDDNVVKKKRVWINASKELCSSPDFKAFDLKQDWVGYVDSIFARDDGGIRLEIDIDSHGNEVQDRNVAKHLEDVVIELKDGGLFEKGDFVKFSGRFKRGDFSESECLKGGLDSNPELTDEGFYFKFTKIEKISQ